jgi:hypothetical protein
MAWHRLVLEDNESHLTSGLFRTFHGDAKFESKQLRSHGMSMSLSKKNSISLSVFPLCLPCSVWCFPGRAPEGAA